MVDPLLLTFCALGHIGKTKGTDFLTHVKIVEMFLFSDILTIRALSFFVNTIFSRWPLRLPCIVCLYTEML